MMDMPAQCDCGEVVELNDMVSVGNQLYCRECYENKEIEYEEDDEGTRMIYRTFNDTEVSELATNIECPYCEYDWQEYDMSDCGETYELECEKCEKEFQMHFDAS